MFLKQTLERNRALIETAFELHGQGRVLPDSYIVDVDTFLENANKILLEAQKQNFRMYFMLKQVGRNPYLAGELVKLGYSGAVVVDFKEAQIMMQNQIPIGNVGHLVQIPEAMMKQVVAYGSEVITVYSLEKVQAIDRAAGELGKKQGIMLRVYGDQDMVYSGQEAGFSLAEVAETAKIIERECPHVAIRGVTSFPCYLYDETARDIVPANNLETVLLAKQFLEDQGFRELIVNTPSATCIRTIKKMAENGGNCGEPGHGFSGTTPLHAQEGSEELPAVAYVSEISHNFMGNAYCYGGGYYRRSYVTKALVGKTAKAAGIREVMPPSDGSIDYHFGIAGHCQMGDTVVMAFRFQIFVTRSDVVLVRGIGKGRPELAGVYDSLGRKKDIL